MPTALHRDLETARAIAREAGRYLLEKRAALLDDDGAVAHDIKGRNDFVTAADKGSEALIRDRLAAAFPGDQFLGEESGGAGWDSDSVWIVDPLDGTTNFIRGLPLFSVSIGRLRRGKAELGVIHDPVHDECFSGGAGLGAWRNAHAIRCRPAPDLTGAFVATGFPFREVGRLEEYARLFTAVTRASQGVRRCGSAAIDLAWTACGRFTAFFEQGLSHWDIAAGWAIVEGAGGVVTDLYTPNAPLPGGHLLAADPSVHRQLQELFLSARG